MGRARRRSVAVHRSLAAVAGLGLLGATLVAGPTAAADEGLAEASHNRFVLDTQDDVVEATVTVTLRNVTPDRHTAEGTYSYFYDAYGVPVPAGAKNVRAVSGGASLPVRFDATDDPSMQIATASFSQLYYGQSRTIEWTYDIPGAPIRSEDYTRVGPGYATFAAQGVGDPGQVTVEVVLPAAMSFDSTADVFTSSRDGRTTTYTATENTDEGGIWAAVSARDADQADEKHVEVGDVRLTLQSFPGDREWLRFVSKQVTAGLPVLEKTVGQPWPGGLDTIREDVSPQVLGYAWFDHGADEIVIAEDLDEVILFHELTHAWLNPDRIDGRWLYEGLTEVVAHRVADATGGSGTPRRTPDRDAPGALPLTTWRSFGSERSPEVEQFAYAASYAAVEKLVGDLDDETFSGIVAAAYAGESAYEVPGTKVNGGQTDWRRFLDLVEIRAGVDRAPKVYRTWVVDRDGRAELAARADAREAYTALDTADGEWRPPRGLRAAMTDWDFEEAGTIVDGPLGYGVPGDAAEVQSAAEAAGLPVPAPVRDAYEGADDDEEYAQLTNLLPRATEVIGAVGEASDAAAAGEDPVSALGARLLAVEQVVDDARSALADGDLDEAAALADTATERAGWAVWLGIGVIVLALVLLAGAVLGVLGIRRRPRRRARSADGYGSSRNDDPFRDEM